MANVTITAPAELVSVRLTVRNGKTDEMGGTYRIYRIKATLSTGVEVDAKYRGYSSAYMPVSQEDFSGTLFMIRDLCQASGMSETGAAVAVLNAADTKADGSTVSSPLRAHLKRLARRY